MYFSKEEMHCHADCPTFTPQSIFTPPPFNLKVNVLWGTLQTRVVISHYYTIICVVKELKNELTNVALASATSGILYCN